MINYLLLCRITIITNSIIMDKRYQIFISSTYEDLKDERAKVQETVLKLNCFPAGMEQFPAMSIKLFEYIKKIIDDSDYYLLIIGGRYGSVDKSSGKSWTEQEFDYAVSKGIPVMVFDHEDFTKLPANKTDQNDEKRKKLLDFKKKAAEDRLIKKWSNADNLATEVSYSLSASFVSQRQRGWVRAENNINDDLSDIDTNAVQDELNTLKFQAIEDRKKQLIIEHSYNEARSTIQNLESELNKLIKMLNTSKISLDGLTSKIFLAAVSFETKGVSFKMVFVKGGTFSMGTNNKEEISERPAHAVTLSDYWIGETQVTQALWKAVMNNNPSGFYEDPRRPVENVSWDDCQKFIEKLNEELKDQLNSLGLKFSLPTEAQWEFAARGGNSGKSNGNIFAGSDDIDKVAWYQANSDNHTHPVATDIKPNELGLYDMSGNVWEWCQDWYGDYSSESQQNPKGPDKGSYRIGRGGGWGDLPKNCRLSCRYRFSQSRKTNAIGLRLALIK